MLTNILGLSDRELEQVLDALSQGNLDPGTGTPQLHTAGRGEHAQVVQAWLVEAMARLGSIDRVIDVLRLLRAQRSQCITSIPLPELILTGPEAEGIATRDTRVVVREMFESARSSVLLVGYAFYRCAEIFQPLADRMAGNSRLRVRIILNVHPKRGQAAEATVKAFAAEFLRTCWPFYSRPGVYYDLNSLLNAKSDHSSLHAKLIVVDRRWVYLGSANFTHAAFHRNLEAGIRMKNERLGKQLVDYFDQLIEGGRLMRLFETVRPEGSHDSSS